MFLIWGDISSNFSFAGPIGSQQQPWPIEHQHSPTERSGSGHGFFRPSVVILRSPRDMVVVVVVIEPMDIGRG
jgi:hypothetical protein